MKMIAFIIFNSNWLPIIEGLLVYDSNPCEFEFSVLERIEATTYGLTVPRSDQLSNACKWGLLYIYLCIMYI